ncbi:MAG: hypothetical protein RLZZ455_581, partial [Candidatus Parcubacteria bacterium]|jgi:hypothetical protein
LNTTYYYEIFSTIYFILILPRADTGNPQKEGISQLNGYGFTTGIVLRYISVHEGA